MPTATYRKTVDATNLRESLPLRRLRDHLHDLIIIALETYTRIPGKSYSLTRLQYVCDEKLEERFSMHFDALAKELDLNENIPLKLTLSVSAGGDECYPHL